MGFALVNPELLWKDIPLEEPGINVFRVLMAVILPAYLLLQHPLCKFDIVRVIIEQRKPFNSLDKGVVKPIFRPHKQCDYITTRNPVRYHNFNWFDPKVQELLKYLNEVFDSKQLINYIIQLLGYCMFGGNLQHIGIVFYGIGQNSKTVFVHLLEQLFKRYWEHIPTQNLCLNARFKFNQYHSIEPSTRIALVTDIDEKININNLIMKNDVVPILVANNKIKFHKLNAQSTIGGQGLSSEKNFGSKIKLIVIPFESTFTRHLNGDKRQYLLNPYMFEKMQDLADSMLWLIVRKYNHKFDCYAEMPNRS